MWLWQGQLLPLPICHPYQFTSPFTSNPLPLPLPFAQELSSTLGLVKLSERLNDPTCQEWYDGIFPKVGPHREGKPLEGGGHTRAVLQGACCKRVNKV